MKNNKYTFTGKTRTALGIELRQIVALKDFGQVKKGDIGGWIESENNLSADGNSWVRGDARVSGNARVSGDAWVFGNAWVSGDARVSGRARVSGDAQVSGDAWVFDNVWVSDNARVFDNAGVYGDARVFGDAQVSGNARVSGDAQVFGDAQVTKKVITLSSHQYQVTITDNHIRLGCQQRTIAEWKKLSKRAAHKLFENDDDVAQWFKYKEFILMLASEDRS